MKNLTHDQFTAIRPSYFHRHGVCDMFPKCFRPATTTIYAFDAAGLETPVLCLCSIHSGTEETELLPFDKLNLTMVKEAIRCLKLVKEVYTVEDIVLELIRLGYERQINWASREDLIVLIAQAITIEELK